MNDWSATPAVQGFEERNGERVGFNTDVYRWAQGVEGCLATAIALVSHQVLPPATRYFNTQWSKQC